jgi:hypothetical protein
MTLLIQKGVGEIQNQARKTSVRYRTKKKPRPVLCLFLSARIYFLVEEGHPLSGSHGTFSVQSLLRAVLCLLRGGGRFLSNGCGTVGASIATRAFASFRAKPASNSIITLVPQPAP